MTDAPQENALHEDEAAIVHAQALTATRKTSARKSVGAQTSTATKQAAHRSQGSKKPSTNAGHTE